MRRNLIVSDVSAYPVKIATVIAENESQLKALLSRKQTHTWSSLMLVLDEMKNRLQLIWLELEHRHNVIETDEVKEVYQTGRDSVDAYQARLAQAISTGLVDYFENESK